MVSATAASTASQKPPQDPDTVPIGRRSRPTTNTTSASTTSTETYFRSTLIAPSGLIVSAVVMPPAITTQTHDARCPWVNACKPCEMTTSSNTAQPRHCAMFSTVGRNDAFAPSRPRINTMAGAPVFAPSTRVAPRIRPPSTDPTTIAVDGGRQVQRRGARRLQYRQRAGETEQADAEVAPQAELVEQTERARSRLGQGAAAPRSADPRAGCGASGLAEDETATGADEPGAAEPGDDGVSDDGETETDTTANLSLRRY